MSNTKLGIDINSMIASIISGWYFNLMATGIKKNPASYSGLEKDL